MSFSPLALSAQYRRIIDTGRFLMGSPPEERRGGRGEVPPEEKRGDRGVFQMQYQSLLTVLLPLPMQEPTGVSYFWCYQPGATVLLTLANF